MRSTGLCELPLNETVHELPFCGSDLGFSQVDVKGGEPTVSYRVILQFGTQASLHVRHVPGTEKDSNRAMPANIRESLGEIGNDFFVAPLEQHLEQLFHFRWQALESGRVSLNLPEQVDEGQSAQSLELRIGAEQAQRKLQESVEPGISFHHSEKVFETLAGAVLPGAGIGLAHEIAQLSDGEITIAKVAAPIIDSFQLKNQAERGGHGGLKGTTIV